MIQNLCATCRLCASPAHAGEHNFCTGETKYRPTRPLETRDRSGNTVTCLVQIERPSSRPNFNPARLRPRKKTLNICLPNAHQTSRSCMKSSQLSDHDQDVRIRDSSRTIFILSRALDANGHFVRAGWAGLSQTGSGASTAAGFAISEITACAKHPSEPEPVHLRLKRFADPVGSAC